MIYILLSIKNEIILFNSKYTIFKFKKYLNVFIVMYLNIHLKNEMDFFQSYLQFIYSSRLTIILKSEFKKNSKNIVFQNFKKIQLYLKNILFGIYEICK